MKGKYYYKDIINWLKIQGAVSYQQLNLSKLLGCLNSLLTIVQAWLLAYILHSIIIEYIPRKALLVQFITLIIVFVIRAWLVFLREQIGFLAGQKVRYNIRKKIIDRLQQAGPTWIQNKPIGSWSTLVLEQIENLHDYYAHYIPQMSLAVYIPLIIVIFLFFINWIAATILLFTAPLIPLFMMVVGMNAADANRRNFIALARLSGNFFDRLQGIETIHLFDRGHAEIENIDRAAKNFRHRTMEVLRLAFLSSSILEFFTSLSIAIIAVYFGFSYLGKLNFDRYNVTVTLLTGFLTLILAPEFFKPLRDLGSFYHAKAQAIGAADNVKSFLENQRICSKNSNIILKSNAIHIVAENLSILSTEGRIIAGPLNFTLPAGQRVMIIGSSGSGKSLLLKALAGFLPYTGSLRINNVEFSTLNLDAWRKNLSWLGQHPQLPAATLRDNVLLANPHASEEELNNVLKCAWVHEFLKFLPEGINSIINNHGINLSIGQIQRIAIARTLLKPCQLLLLDEPTESLDTHSELRIVDALNKASVKQTTLMVTHKLYAITEWDQIWIMKDGLIM